MLLIERHLLRQFAETIAAVAIVLLLVSLGAIIADLIQEVAHGKVPAGLLLSQAGLRSVRFVTLVLPLALFLGLMLAIGRLYADSEMAVLASIGLGPQQLWRPLFWVTLPIMLVVASASLWLAPWSAHKARTMIDTANRSFLIAGLEPGRFVELPGQAGILYVSELSTDGTSFKHLFVQREDKGRLDIITAHDGDLHLIGQTQRMLRLRNGFRIEGALGSRDFRMMRFEKNEVRVPDREANDADDLSAVSTTALFTSGKPSAVAEIHWRLAMPIFVSVLALFAVPLARSEPRQSRYGGVLIAILVYIIGIALIFVGTALIAGGRLPPWLGLWWLHLPLLALSVWLYRIDGRISRPKRVAA
jgi:lipopolysaccharide export system permease protein